MRDTTAAMTAAVSAPVVYPIWMVRLHFDSGVGAFHSGFGTITYEGVEYLGVGTLTSITPPSEQPGVKASSVSVTLSGLKQEVVAMLLLEPYLGRKAYIHLALTDEDGVFDANKVKLMFPGTMDNLSGNMGQSASFTLSIKSRLADWERARNLQYNDSDQQRLYPGDRFMEFIPQISKMKIIWPKAAALVDPRD